MRYQGGKSKIADKLAAVIRQLHPSASEIWEPAFASASVIAPPPQNGFRVYASDVHEDLILMWQAFMRGETEPFVDATEAEYQALRNAASSARRGFVGYSASFGSSWFGGWARDSTGKRNFLDEARRNNSRLNGLPITFYHCDYTKPVCRHAAHSDNILVYADIPYKGTKTYKGGPIFDHVRFWQWVRERKGPTFVSEITGPNDIPIIWRQSVNGHTSAQKFIEREEKLYYKFEVEV